MFTFAFGISYGNTSFVHVVYSSITHVNDSSFRFSYQKICKENHTSKRTARLSISSFNSFSKDLYFNLPTLMCRSVSITSRQISSFCKTLQNAKLFVKLIFSYSSKYIISYSLKYNLGSVVLPSRTITSTNFNVFSFINAYKFRKKSWSFFISHCKTPFKHRFRPCSSTVFYCSKWGK